MSHAQASFAAILYALLANLGIAVMKTVAAVLTGSASMLAEAVHSLADSGNQVLLIIGLRQSKKPADALHPLGYGKSIYVWSFIVAVMLFSMGGLFSLYEGILKLSSPHPLVSPGWAIGVLAFSIVLEALSLAGALRQVRKVRGPKGLRAWLSTSRNSELLVVLGEDTAALVGLSFALGAVGLSVVTGNPVWDALGSIAIGVVLLLVSVGIGIKVKHLLVGESADPEFTAALRAHVARQPGVAEVLNLITLQMGEDVVLAVKARMAAKGGVRGLIAAINAAERSVKRRFPAVKWIFFEPDDRD